MGLFERFEYKYLTTKALSEDFKRTISSHTRGDSHCGSDGSYAISSLYFDNDYFELYYQTKDKIPFRQKLRLRIYGRAEETSQSFFEVKNKLNGKTFKNRFSLPLCEAVKLYTMAGAGEDCSEFRSYAVSSQDIVALEEVIRVISRYSLKPSAVVSYNREAYYCPELPSLRITFDSGLRVRTNELDLVRGSYGIPAMRDDEVVIEVKCDCNMPSWLSEALGLRRLMNRSFSKYCSLDLTRQGHTARGESLYIPQV
ncbi:MAG: VTC domain-containing protein [Eubacteriales bacterium]